MYTKNMRMLLDMMKEKGAELIIRTPMPTKFQDRGEKLPSYIEKLKELAEEEPDIIFIDQYTEMKKVCDEYPYLWSTEYLFEDAPEMILHPGAKGQIVMTRMFIKGCGLWVENGQITKLFYK